MLFTNNNYILPISYNPDLIGDLATEKNIVFMSKTFIYIENCLLSNVAFEAPLFFFTENEKVV